MSLSHSPDHIILVEPSCFGFNEETASSNAFQKNIPVDDHRVKATEEFSRLITIMEKNEISFTVFENVKDENTPDAVFPNNWFSVHGDTLFLYPMMSVLRRKERNPEVIGFLRKNFGITKVIDLAGYEKENKFLEGTGSIVFDHTNRIAYACVSPRTDLSLLKKVCDELNYRSVSFRAHGPKGEEVYHTNVVMSVGEKFILICLESIDDILERKIVEKEVLQSGKKVIPITFSQMNHFAGNMLEVSNKKNKLFLLMSETAFQSLDKNQVDALSQFASILPVAIPTIETLGGGSIRCMMAGFSVQNQE